MVRIHQGALIITVESRQHFTHIKPFQGEWCPGSWPAYPLGKSRALTTLRLNDSEKRLPPQTAAKPLPQLMRFLHLFSIPNYTYFSCC